jgi:hypothetical protein
LHGANRNGADYRDFFIADSERRGFLVVAPEFSEAQYAHPHDYNYGGMRRADGTFAPREEWLFPVVDAVFRDASARAGSTRGGYFLFGHSAGAQVVHRLVTFAWSPLIEGVVAANAGSYTLPVRYEAFPHGLDGPESIVDLRALFSRPLCILLGDRDNDPNHEQLPRDPGAMRQGAPSTRPRRQTTSRSRSARRQRPACRSSGASPLAPGVAHSARRWLRSPRASSSANSGDLPLEYAISRIDCDSGRR